MRSERYHRDIAKRRTAAALTGQLLCDVQPRLRVNSDRLLKYTRDRTRLVTYAEADVQRYCRK